MIPASLGRREGDRSGGPHAHPGEPAARPSPGRFWRPEPAGARGPGHRALPTQNPPPPGGLAFGLRVRCPAAGGAQVLNWGRRRGWRAGSKHRLQKLGKAGHGAVTRQGDVQGPGAAGGAPQQDPGGEPRQLGTHHHAVDQESANFCDGPDSRGLRLWGRTEMNSETARKT